MNGGNKFPTFLGQTYDYDPAILRIVPAGDQPLVLKAIEDPGHIGRLLVGYLAQLPLGESLTIRQHAFQKMELLQGKVIGLQDLFGKIAHFLGGEIYQPT